MKNTCIITGGAGFIGSHLLEMAIEKYNHVTVIDNLSTGHLKNIEPYLDRITFIEECVSVIDYSKLSKVDTFFHLAAQASVPLSISEFEKSSISNLIGTVKAINYCNKTSAKFIYASSSAVYGNLDIGSESGDVDLLSPYAVDKYVMELYSSVFKGLTNFSSCGLRFFNVYGPKQDFNSSYSGVIPIFVRKMLKRESIIINGGYQSRDFIYVKDVADIMLDVADKLDAKENFPTVLNIATGNIITIDELANKLQKLINFVDKEYNELDASDPILSTSNMREFKTNFPNYKFSEFDLCITETIKWIKNSL